jgi:Ca-activated chloride channel family protein
MNAGAGRWCRTVVGVVGMAELVFAFACGRGTPTTAKKSPDESITIAAALGSTQVRANATDDVLVRITVEAHDVVRRGRPPVNLALVVDTSGSMEGRAIEDARAASAALVESLSPEDRLAVVVFHSKTEVLLPSTQLKDADMTDVRAKIRGMKAEGTTDMSQGLAAGISEVTKNLDADGINRVILLGDGVPNEQASIEPMAKAAGERGISVTVLGLGADYNESLMGKIAQASGGRFHYVEDSTKVLSFFKEEVVRLQKIGAKNATVELNPGPGVTVDGVIGQSITSTGRGVSVLLGDMAFGDKRELIVRLKVAPHKDGVAVELLDSVVRFSEPIGGASGERRLFVGAHASADAAKVHASRNEDVEKSAAKAKEAAATLEEIQRARDSDRPGGAPRVQREPSNRPGAPVTGAPEMAMPMASPAAVGPPAAKQVRMRHDEAMRTLQGD